MRGHPALPSRLRLAALLLGMATLQACASVTPIGDLLAEPHRYNGREVTVRGDVTRGGGVLGIGAYEVNDGTGTIVVIAQGQGVPSQGSRTKVKGRFESVFSFAGRTVAALVQSQRE